MIKGFICECPKCRKEFIIHGNNYCELMEAWECPKCTERKKNDEEEIKIELE